MKDHYDACDPIAVAVAMHPEVIDEVIEKRCYIETEGSITRGTVIVDWFERYPIKKPRPHVKIVTKVKGEMIVDLMTDSVLE
jgi:inosine-uridine nucleoside N-ribohydrolase